MQIRLRVHFETCSPYFLCVATHLLGRQGRLPIYGCDFKDGDVWKGIIDSGATSIYVNDKLVKKLSLPVTKIATRKVRIADKEVVVVHGYTTIDVKTGDLPVESVMAYLFPLDNIDLVLGLPWLQKHNP